MLINDIKAETWMMTFEQSWPTYFFTVNITFDPEQAFDHSPLLAMNIYIVFTLIGNPKPDLLPAS